jgi:hypothetical protein
VPQHERPICVVCADAPEIRKGLSDDVIMRLVFGSSQPAGFATPSVIPPISRK